MIKYLLALCCVALFAVPASAQCVGGRCYRSTTTYTRPAVQHTASQTRLVKVCNGRTCYYVRQMVPGSYQVKQQSIRATTVKRPVLDTTVTRERVVTEKPVARTITVSSPPSAGVLAALLNL